MEVEVVRDWLRSLDEADRRAVGLDLMRIQFRWPVGMPLCKAMGDGLWEIRTNLPGNRIVRTLFSNCMEVTSSFSMFSSRKPRRRRKAN